MKAAAFFETGPGGQLRYAEVPTPTVGPRDVLVRVQACGVNHSDLDSWKGDVAVGVRAAGRSSAHPSGR